MKKRRRTKKKPVLRDEQVITFDVFFAKCVREDKLRFWQRSEVEAFFKDLRLRTKEYLVTFEEALNKF